MTDSNYIKLYTGNFIMVQRMVDSLATVGIVPVIKDETESGRLAGFPPATLGLQELYANKDELHKAQAIVEVIKTEMEAQ